MRNILFLIYALILISISGCEAIGDIFSAGFYTGLAVVVAVAVLIIWLVGRRRS